MKQMLKRFMLILLFIFIVACEKQGEEVQLEKSTPEQKDLVAYIEDVELPTNFTLDVDPEMVTDVAAAKTYTATFATFDDDQVKEALLHNDVIATRNHAEGVQVEAGDESWKEFLTIFDGGKSLDMDSGVNGGISYGLWIDGEVFPNKLSKVIANAPGPPDSIGQKFGYNVNDDYDSKVDLSFKSYTDAFAEIEELLNQIGFPDLEVAETYSLDLDTMLEHYELYLDSRDHFGAEEDDEESFSKDDEAYLFFLRQVIDDIPLSNVHWQEQALTTDEVTTTTIDIYYSKDGVRDIDARNLFDVLESGEEQPLISGKDALKTVIDDYSELLLSDETRIFSIELNYVALYNNQEKNYELVPAWIVGVAEASAKGEQEESEEMVESYRYIAVNAFTGEKIEKASASR